MKPFFILSEKNALNIIKKQRFELASKTLTQHNNNRF